jgi:hypothetical protein
LTTKTASAVSHIFCGLKDIPTNYISRNYAEIAFVCLLIITEKIKMSRKK